jgi:hypothetical protein
MNKALSESKILADLLLSEEQKEKIKNVLREIRENHDCYDAGLFWELDSSIGGIGGYCMPADPKINPFPGGIGRELFRPLQYARSKIDICDINYSARHVVHYSGMHLEAVIRYVLENSKPLGLFKRNNLTLGKAVRILEKENMVTDENLSGFNLFVKIYNKSKHDVNQDEERERLFDPADALIVYTCSRILGKIALKKHYPEILMKISEYIDRLEGLNMDL